MTRNDKIERAFTALKQATTEASGEVGGPESDTQIEAILSLNKIMDEINFILCLPEIVEISKMKNKNSKVKLDTGK